MRTPSIVFLLVLLLAVTGQAQTYFLNGDASYLGDDCYQLTPNLNPQNGTVWYADQIDLMLHLRLPSATFIFRNPLCRRTKSSLQADHWP